MGRQIVLISVQPNVKGKWWVIIPRVKYFSMIHLHDGIAPSSFLLSERGRIRSCLFIICLGSIFRDNTSTNLLWRTVHTSFSFRFDLMCSIFAVVMLSLWTALISFPILHHFPLNIWPPWTPLLFSILLCMSVPLPHFSWSFLLIPSYPNLILCYHREMHSFPVKSLHVSPFLWSKERHILGQVWGWWQGRLLHTCCGI